MCAYIPPYIHLCPFSQYSSAAKTYSREPYHVFRRTMYVYTRHGPHNIHVATPYLLMNPQCAGAICCFPFAHLQMVVHIFLFTDILLVTKPHRRGGDKYTVVRPVRGRHRNKCHCKVVNTINKFCVCIAALQDCLSCVETP